MTSRTRSASSPRLGIEPGDRERQADVLADVQERDEVERLEDEAGPVAAQARGLVVVEGADRLALEEDLAGRRPVEAAEELEERALAAARRTHQGDELAGRHGQGHAAQGLDGRLAEGIGLGQVARLEDRRSSPSGVVRRGIERDGHRVASWGAVRCDGHRRSAVRGGLPVDGPGRASTGRYGGVLSGRSRPPAVATR